MVVISEILALHINQYGSESAHKQSSLSQRLFFYPCKVCRNSFKDLFLILSSINLSCDVIENFSWLNSFFGKSFHLMGDFRDWGIILLILLTVTILFVH